MLPHTPNPAPTGLLKRALLGAVAMSALAGAVQAAEIEAQSRIEAVTVFPDGAMVTRTVAVDLAPGSHLLVFRGLPLSIDPASLRVEGKATAALGLGAVDMRLSPVDPGKLTSEGEAKLKVLREERDRLTALLDAQEGRKAMIQRFGQSGPERGEKADGLAVDQWAAAWSAVGEALTKVNDELRQTRAALATVEANLKAQDLAETNRRSRVAPEREFTLAVEASEALKGALTLSYRVSGASWRPVYDAKLTTGDAGKGSGMVLTRRAIVTQRSGEDWSDIDLSLSTVRAQGGTAAPEVQPQRVAFYELPMPVPMAMARRNAMAEADKAASEKVMAAPAPMAAGAPPAAVVAVAPQAAVDANDFQASYRIPGKLSVPRDGSQKSFAILSRDVVPDLMIKAAPGLDPTAYLEAAFVNQEEAPLLAGDVSLIRDGSFIGKGRIAFTAPGDRVSLGFGADDRVKVSRVPVKRRETEPSLLGSTKSDTREFKISVKNLHDFAIRVQIVDQIPFSEASNLTVEPLAGMTPPTEKAIDDKRGVMGWTYDLKPKEDKDIRFGYKIRWPSDRELTFQRAPNPR